MIKDIKEVENVIKAEAILSYLAYILIKKKNQQKVINTSKLGENI